METSLSTPSPLVSVLIPVYQVEAYIARCLQSVLSQSYRPLELILIDDRGEDRSMQIAKELLADVGEGREVRLLQNEKNEGLAYCRMRLLEEARGKYCLWLDSDDYWHGSQDVERIIEVMERDQLDCLVMDYYADYPKRIKYMKVDCPDSGEEATRAILTGRMPAYLCNKCFRTDVLRRYGGRFGGGRYRLEDYRTAVPFFAASPRMAYLPMASLHYEQSNSNSLIATLGGADAHELMAAVDFCKEELWSRYPTAEQLYGQAIAMAYLSMKAVSLSRCRPADYATVRALHPEVDHLNASRPIAWYHRLIYSLQIHPKTSYIGYALLLLLNRWKSIIRR